MSDCFSRHLRRLRFHGALVVAAVIALNNSLIAQGDLDDISKIRESKRKFPNSVTDLKGLREQKLNEFNLYIGVSDAGMRELSECNTLWSLGLFGAEVPKTGLKGLGKLKNLKELVVLGPVVTDADLAEFKALKNLTTLFLSSPRSTITDAGLKELRPLKNLTRLELGFAQHHGRWLTGAPRADKCNEPGR